VLIVCLFVQTLWSEKEKTGGAAFLPHPLGSEDCPVPLPKTVRRAKGFKEAYSTDEVARQACTVFGSSTSVGMAKTPPLPFFPSSRNSVPLPGWIKDERSACGADSLHLQRGEE